MEGLGPPLVGREAEAGDGRGAVGELLDLLREGEEGDKGAGAGVDGEGGVAEGEGGVARGLACRLRELVTGDWWTEACEEIEEELEDRLPMQMKLPHLDLKLTWSCPVVGFSAIIGVGNGTFS